MRTAKLEEKALDTTEIVYGGGNRLRPARIAILRFCYLRQKLSSNPYLTKTQLRNLLYEPQYHHVDDHFKEETDKPKIVFKECFDIQKTRYSLADFKRVKKYFPDRVFSWEDVIESLEAWERLILLRSDYYRRLVDELKDFVIFSAYAIMKKYNEIFDRISTRDKRNLVSGLRTGELHYSLLLRFLGGVLPSSINVLTRFFLEIWVASVNILLLTYKDRDEFGMTDFDPSHIIKENISLLIDSQRENGSWGFQGYERGLLAKETGLVTRFLVRAKNIFGDEIEIPREKIAKAKDFLRGSLQKKDGKFRCKIRDEYLKQTTFTATFNVLWGLNYADMFLENKDVEERLRDPWIKGTLEYLLSLQRKDGGFGQEGYKSDMITTASMSWILFNQNVLGLDEDIIYQFTGKKIDCAKIISYIYTRKKSIEDEINERERLYVPLVSLNALLLCGCWPYSSHILEPVVEIIKYTKQDLQDILKLPIPELITPTALITIIPPAGKILSSKNVIGHAIECLKILKEYEKNPNIYWRRVERLMKYSDSLQ